MNDRNGVTTLAVPTKGFVLDLRTEKVKVLTADQKQAALTAFLRALKAVAGHKPAPLPMSDDVLHEHSDEVRSPAKRQKIGDAGFRATNTLGKKVEGGGTPPPLFATSQVKGFYGSESSLWGPKASIGRRQLEAGLPSAPAASEPTASTRADMHAPPHRPPQPSQPPQPPQPARPTQPHHKPTMSIRDRALYGAPSAPQKALRDSLMPSQFARPEPRASPLHPIARVTTMREQQGSGGFHNIGNSCYINAVLSALLGLGPFVADMLSMFPRLGKFVSQPSVYEALHSLASQRATGDGSVATPRRVKDAIAQRCAQFSTNQQQDAHEFFSDAIDALHEELSAAATALAADEITPPLPGAVPEMLPPSVEELPSYLNFHIVVEHELTCTKCGHRWTRLEPLRDFSLDIPRAASRQPTIADLLRTFFADDALEVSCEECDSQRATVVHRIAQLPRVLMLHLKRFEMGTAGVRKRADPVQPSHHLSLDFCCTAAVKPPPPITVAARSAVESKAPLAATPKRYASNAEALAAASEQATNARRTLSFTGGDPTSPPNPNSKGASGRGPPSASRSRGQSVVGASRSPLRAPPPPFSAPVYSKRAVPPAPPGARQGPQQHAGGRAQDDDLAAAIAASLDSFESDARRRSPADARSPLGSAVAGGSSAQGAVRTPPRGAGFVVPTSGPQGTIDLGDDVMAGDGLPYAGMDEEEELRLAMEISLAESEAAATQKPATGLAADDGDEGFWAEATQHADAAERSASKSSRLSTPPRAMVASAERAVPDRSPVANVGALSPALAPAMEPDTAAAVDDPARTPLAASNLVGSSSNPLLLESGPSSRNALLLESGHVSQRRPALAAADLTGVGETSAVDLTADEKENGRAAAGVAVADPRGSTSVTQAGGGTLTLGGKADYILCAVVWHAGAQAGSGHYIADVRQPTSKGLHAQWKRFDDAFVRQITHDAPDALTKGYMYFYLHRSVLEG